jgi:diguanylate cyclase (GGDEF)-like protein
MLPGLLVVGTAAVALALLDESTLAAVTGRYALVVYGAGAILAAVFHRSRVVVALLGLTFLDLLFVGHVVDNVDEARLVPMGTVLVAMFGILSLTRDRGLLSRAGAIQVGVSVAAVALAYALLRDPVALEAFGSARFLPGGSSARAGIPDSTLLTAALSIGLSAYAIFRWRGAVERALLWTQALVLTALHPSVGGNAAGVICMAAGLVVAVSVIEQSYFMAYRDELTGLPARRALMRDLAELSGTYSVAMVDVDHFKKFNDKHGHDVGDQVLQLVASRLSASSEAKAYRYGGEEFTLLFPRLSREDAVAGAETVRAAVEEATFALRSWKRPRKRPSASKAKAPKRPRTLSVTVSIGLADSGGGEAPPEAILKKADQALYRAKEEGRNRVSL